MRSKSTSIPVSFSQPALDFCEPVEKPLSRYMKRKLYPDRVTGEGQYRFYPKGTDSYSRLYRIWGSMKRRCYAPAHVHFDNYGGRGINVCDEWLVYENFRVWAIASGYSDDLTIERKDNDLNYNSDNCKWIPRNDQQKNRRTNRLVIAFGETKTVAEWARDPRCCILAPSIYKRLDAGMEPEKAITMPAQLQEQFKSRK